MYYVRSTRNGFYMNTQRIKNCTCENCGAQININPDIFYDMPVTWMDRVSNYLLPAGFTVTVILTLFTLIVACGSKTGPKTAKGLETSSLIQKALDGELKEMFAPYTRLAPVHFPTASDAPYKDDLAKLDENAEWLKAHPEAAIILEGHCDKRGNDLYNLMLGDRRARTIKSFLIDKGVAIDRFGMVVSYGEKMPVDESNSIEAMKKNRRVEFVVR